MRIQTEYSFQEEEKREVESKEDKIDERDLKSTLTSLPRPNGHILCSIKTTNSS